MVSDFYKTKMIERLDKRKNQFLSEYNVMIDLVNAGKVDGEANRLWIEEQIKGLKTGLDICCGDFLIKPESSEGVDGDSAKLGAVWYIDGSELVNVREEWADYVVTNYIEAFPNTYKALNEWKRVLKPGGVLAFVCSDADKWPLKGGGPLRNRHRQSIFTKKTIAMYLTAVGFINIQIVDGPEEDKTMRVRCNK